MTHRLPRFALALAIGTVGALVFNHFQLPLAWMLGAMTACTLASLAGAPIVALETLRPFTTAVIGVLLGSGFPPNLLGELAGWLPSLLGLVAFILISAAIGTLYFRHVAGFDLPTAYFSAMPGGLVEMMALGRERGGDERLIALIHSARILLVVASLPYVLVTVFGVDMMALRPAARASVLDTPWTAEVWLVACALLGMGLGRLLHLPARYLLGPMLLSGAVHMSGLSGFQPAQEVVVVAQLVMGTLIGSRFSGLSPRLVAKAILLSGGSVVLLLTAASLISALMARLTPFPPEALLLAYSPGGLTEMSLVALSMGMEVAFVASHHIARVLIVVLTAAVLFPLAARR